MVFARVIFCGSVLSYDFKFQQISDRFVTPVLNEVGSQDAWPAFAESVTWGYGSAGTFGFRRFRVEDRWHNGAGHGYFLNADFCRKFWIPFLKRGEVQPGAAKPEPTRPWLRVLHVIRPKYVLIVLALAFVARASVDWPCSHNASYHLGEDDTAPFFLLEADHRADGGRSGENTLLGSGLDR